MNLLLTGFSPRDEAVFELFLKRFQPGWKLRSHPVQQDGELPGADVVLLDLLAYGWPKASETSVARLQALLGARVAVLLHPAQDRTWPQIAGAGTGWAFLAKPYGAEPMREALLAAQQRLKQVPPVVPVATQPAQVPTPVPPQVAPQVPTQASTLPSPPSVAPATASAASGPEPVDWLKKFRDIGREPTYLLRDMLFNIEQGVPFEVRFTVHNMLIVEPAAGWVASNTPLQVVQRVCRSAVLASSVGLAVLDGLQAESRVQRLGLVPQDLNDYLHQLLPPLLASTSV